MAHRARGEEHDVGVVLLAEARYEEGDEDVDRESGHGVFGACVEQERRGKKKGGSR